MKTHPRRDNPYPFEGQRLFGGRYLLLSAVSIEDNALVVHEALDTATQHKVIATLVLHDRHLVHLRNHVDLAWALHDPHFDTVLQANLSGELLGNGALVRYVITRWLNGGSLRLLCQHTRQHSTPPQQRLALAASLLAELAPALDALHARGIFHANIQPDKVMLHAEEAVADTLPVLIDFGQARHGHAQKQDAAARHGNPAYIPPEQWANALVDGRADQYALAITLYELISGGISPFSAARDALLGHERAIDATVISPRAIWRGIHERGQITPLTTLVPEVTQETCDVLHRALAASAADRYPSIAAFAGALSNVTRTTVRFGEVVRALHMSWREHEQRGAAGDADLAPAAPQPRKPRNPLLRYFSRS